MTKELTQEELISLAEKGGNDATLMLFEKQKEHEVHCEEKISEIKSKIEEIEGELEEVGKENKVEYQQYTTDVAMKLAVNIAGIIKGDDGKTPKKGVDYFTKEEIDQLKKEVTPIKGKDYRDGRDGVDAKPIDIDTVIYEATKATTENLTPLVPTIEQLKKEIPDLSPQVDSNTEKIVALEEEIKKLKEVKNITPMGGINGIGARELVKDIDLSSQLDGVTTTFNIQAIWNVISVNLSSYPYGSLRKNIDYTWTPTSITFTSEIDPATQLSVGQKCILTIIQA